MANRLFGRLKNSRKRVLAERQLWILNLLLDDKVLEFEELMVRAKVFYVNLKNPWRALVRDISNLLNLGAISFKTNEEDKGFLSINLQWPEQITDSQFFETIQKYPSAQTYKFLQRPGLR
jgi:hypothetical protein